MYENTLNSGRMVDASIVSRKTDFVLSVVIMSARSHGKGYELFVFLKPSINALIFALRPSEKSYIAATCSA